MMASPRLTICAIVALLSAAADMAQAANRIKNTNDESMCVAALTAYDTKYLGMVPCGTGRLAKSQVQLQVDRPTDNGMSLYIVKDDIYCQG